MALEGRLAKELPRDLLDTSYLPDKIVWDFEVCCKETFQDLERRISLGELSLCATDDLGRVFLHSAIDNCDMKVQHLLWVKGEEEAALGKSPYRVSPIDWRANCEELPTDGQLWSCSVARQGPWTGHDMPRFLETPLDLAARWGRREQCQFWAARALISTVHRAIGSGLNTEWNDCVTALILGAQRASAWCERRWWFLLGARGLPPIAGIPPQAFRLVVRFTG